MAEPVEDADVGRARVLDRLVRALLLFGGFALVPSLVACFAAGLTWLAVVDVAMYLWIVLLEVLRSKLSYANRVTLVLVAVSALSVVLLLALGLRGAGLLWLVAGPILAALLLDRRAAWIAVAAFATVLLGLGLWITVSTAPFEAKDGEMSPLHWWVMAGNALALVVAGTVMIQAVLGALEAAHERLTKEREVRLRLERDLRHAEQSAAVGALAGGVAHELNNLLQAILVPVALVHDELDDAELRADLAQAVTAATGARDVTSRLLALARRGHGSVDRDVVDVDARVHEIMALVRAAIPPPAVTSYAPGAPGVSICAARGELEVVLVNLCLNAAQAAPRAKITITTRKAPHGAVIVVADDGPGIPEELQERIFEPFFTTRSDGTGIGLASVQRVVESLGGSISLHSRPGETTFEVFLPATAQAPSARAPADLPVRPRPTSRLLLVDDDLRVRTAHRSALARAGYDVVACASGEDGLERLDPSVAILVTDLRMPGMGGAELARRALGRCPTLRVIVCSGLVDPMLEGDLRELGVAEVLHKPVTLAELLHAVAGGREAAAG